MEKNDKAYILHSDGNFFTRAKKAGFGGYINDPEGVTLVEYTEQIKDVKYHFCYEILGLIRGLEIAQSMGIKNIIAYGDDKTLMENVSSLSKIIKKQNISPQELDCLPNNSKIELYIKVLEVIQNFDNFQCHFIPREENKYSDSLSRRYATLIEKNYITQFNDDLRRSEQNLEKGVRPKRRQFFSAPTAVTMQEKNNPFLVAPSRNRPLRTASRNEFNKNYQFVFMEVGTNENHKTIKVFYYKDKNHLDNPIILDTQIFNKEDFNINNYLNTLNSNFVHFDKQRPLWLHSNVIEFNAMFEQKEKIPRDDEVFANFVETYNQFCSMTRVWCHHFPFPHKFSNEIIQKRNQEIELKQQEIQSMEELFEIFANPKLSPKERNKIFGKMFRYHIKEHEEQLGRLLSNDEKKDFIISFEEDLKIFLNEKMVEYQNNKQNSFSGKYSNQDEEDNTTYISSTKKMKI